MNATNATDFSSVIPASALSARLGDPDLRILDCRFELGDANAGWQAYGLGHIPGAYYAHLDTDLSDTGRSGLGRHPLPDPRVFAAILGRWRIQPHHQVVCYDAAGGALAAARAWWLLRTCGHEKVALLDGGWPTWRAAGLPVAADLPLQGREDYPAHWDEGRYLLDADALAREVAAQRVLLLDARATPRFRGDVEPLDSRAGHVPGASNRPFSLNLDDTGCFKSPARLRGEFLALLDGRSPDEVVHMCGSGVTAAHNLLAMEYAGLTGARLYAPSWSGWIVDPARPVATGD
ncbi:sulfurtransferase [Pseudofulvimonas gallinarii]|uniref:Thiosulfate/3-mercaptopyruvate sulfurtransferase n=1 Tax=Pseudofulvimonas gallinarii TaxID=634155 RepID=A0A4V3UU17_9GAMM|nr:sulfurtransferase [Pseudofulvimonas gallinarii]TCS92530.1 thiosulfate/3-mercaptopyruvate sulfurtransferase [Pseudofulvimonas gallinarii]THD12731.1 sulfurtransferase [Pseudofulvimonas gallinarii]